MSLNIYYNIINTNYIDINSESFIIHIHLLSNKVCETFINTVYQHVCVVEIDTF